MSHPVTMLLHSLRQYGDRKIGDYLLFLPPKSLLSDHCSLTRCECHPVTTPHIVFCLYDFCISRHCHLELLPKPVQFDPCQQKLCECHQATTPPHSLQLCEDRRKADCALLSHPSHG